MLSEHETTLEFCGREYPATVRYECDPGDGWPLIEEVEVRTTKPGWNYELDVPAIEVLRFDATDWLDEDQRGSLEGEIDSALKAEALSMDADRRAMEREERSLFRRAA